jgi:hypothetical protein|uniref:Uncharacterized protein n=1 Tax=Bacteriophage sp. TaxID=38018 RepID=A0A8D9PEE5_9VIRU|nr:MAG TPA: hypothetical protein [Bacteriophage sp.]
MNIIKKYLNLLKMLLAKVIETKNFNSTKNANDVKNVNVKCYRDNGDGTMDWVDCPVIFIEGTTKE